MSAPATLRVGILSFAHVHAAVYAGLLRDWPGVEVLVADPDGSDAGELRGRALADELEVDYVDDYEQLFDWAPHAVIVTAENSRHRALVERAAAVGANVLCEKPLATTLEDAAAMLDACERAGVTLMTAYPVRFSPVMDRLRSLVSSGALGTVLAATGTNNGKLPTERSWFTDPELAGGGALVDHVVHLADLLDALTGLRPLRVHAATNGILHSDTPGLAVETGGLVTVTYEDGLIATIDCSWSQPDGAPTWGGLTLDVVGTRGIAAIAPFAQAVGGFAESGRAGIHLPYGSDVDRLMLAEFLGAIREGRAPQPDGAVGVRTLSIVLAAQESVRTGLPVDLG